MFPFIEFANTSIIQLQNVLPSRSKRRKNKEILKAIDGKSTSEVVIASA